MNADTRATGWQTTGYHFTKPHNKQYDGNSYGYRRDAHQDPAEALSIYRRENPGHFDVWLVPNPQTLPAFVSTPAA